MDCLAQPTLETAVLDPQGTFQGQLSFKILIKTYVQLSQIPWRESSKLLKAEHAALGMRSRELTTLLLQELKLGKTRPSTTNRFPGAEQSSVFSGKNLTKTCCCDRSTGPGAHGGANCGERLNKSSEVLLCWARYNTWSSAKETLRAGCQTIRPLQLRQQPTPESKLLKVNGVDPFQGYHSGLSPARARACWTSAGRPGAALVRSWGQLGARGAAARGPGRGKAESQDLLSPVPLPTGSRGAHRWSCPWPWDDLWGRVAMRTEGISFWERSPCLAWLYTWVLMHLGISEDEGQLKHLPCARVSVQPATFVRHTTIFFSGLNCSTSSNPISVDSVNGLSIISFILLSWWVS